MSLHVRVETSQFDACVFVRELPVDGRLIVVSFLLPEINLFRDDLPEWRPPIAALAHQDRELALGHVEPATMLGGVVPLDAAGDAPCVFWPEEFIERTLMMRVQIVGDQHDLLS